MTTHVVISQPVETFSDTISIDQYRKKRLIRRKRVSRRMAKSFPLFAVQFMKEEFSDMNYEKFENDLKGRRKSKKKKGKSQLTKQGRYPLYRKALLEYRFSKKLEDLQKAQEIRNRLFKDFEFLFVLGKERKTYRLPSTAPVRLVRKLSKMRGYKTWEQLDEMWLDATKYEQY